MNGNQNNEVLCAHHNTQGCKRFKSVVNGEIKNEAYIAVDDNNTYLKTKHIIMLRQRDQLAKKNTLFNPQVSCERVQDQKDLPDCQRYMRLSATFKNPTNILDMLIQQKSKSKSKFDVSSAAEIIDHVMRKLILTLMTSSNYQLYLWHDISIVIEQNSGIEIEINKSAMAGMSLLLFGDELPFKEFTRIYEVVSLNELKQDQKSVILCYEMKIRAIAKILLTLLLQRYFDLLQEIPDYKTKAHSKQLLTKQGCLGILQRRKDFFKTLLLNPAIISRIQEYQRYNKVQYLSFLSQVFLQEGVPTWSHVINKTIAKNNTPELYQIKNQFNLQVLIKRLKHALIDKKGNHHIYFFRQLGFYKDQHALLLALMHLKTSAAIQAISYPSISTFLANSRCNDNMVNDELFRFMLRAQQGELDLNLPIDHEPIPHLQKHNDHIRKFQVFEGLSTSKQLLSHDLKQSCPLQVKQMNYLEAQDQDSADYPIQTHNFLTALSSNLGQYTLKLRKNNFISEDYYSQGIRKYQHIFE